MADETQKYEVDDERIKKPLLEIGQLLKSRLPENIGFTLFLYDYGEGGSTFYISSADREDTIKLLKEFIDREESKK